MPILGAAQTQEVHIRSGPYRPPAATISVESNLVEVAATVRGRKRTPEAGLHASDFQIFDNDKPQAITHFQEERGDASPDNPAVPATPTPRYLALFFDDTHSGVAGFERSRHAAEKWISTNLRHDDRVAIFSGSGAVALDFTADVKTLLATLAAMKRHPAPFLDHGFGVCPNLTIYQAYVIAKHLDDKAKQIAVSEILACSPGKPHAVAVIEAQQAAETTWEHLRHEPAEVIDTLVQVTRRLAAQPGTRILLMVSPGFLTGGMDREKTALFDLCLRTRVAINALDDEGLIAGAGDAPEALDLFQGGREEWADHNLGQRNLIQQGFLVEAAESTGGEFVHNTNDLTRALQMLTVPHTSYVLGFSPSDPPDGKYHKLKVTVAKPGYEVKARPGYLAASKEKAPETPQQGIDRVAATAESLDEVPASITVQAIDGRIQVNIAVDARVLKFDDQKGVSAQQLTFVTILEDTQGSFLDGKQALMDLELTPATRADLEVKGIKAATSFHVAKGTYRIREVIREAVQNRLNASTTTVEVR